MAYLNFLPEALRPDPWFLAAGVAADLLFGDPEYPAHPIRLIGWTLTKFENTLRRIKLDGYAGGVLLFVLLSTLWIGATFLLASTVIHIFLVYSLLALRDLLRHGAAVNRATSLDSARQAIAKLVGRDTTPMDHAACRRAAIESLSENLTDGFISPIFWYAIAGLPGLVLFKVVSTMDSMVGYKTPQYLQFGWCGARLDDLMNLIPARLTYLLIAIVSIFVPGCSAKKALRIGWQQHALVPGPNSGWSEATTAGALQRKLIGPIWNNGTIVTDIWLGDQNDPPAGTPADYRRATILLTTSGMIAATLAFIVLL